MWVVSVMPIGKAAAHKEFSYFSLHEHKEGAIARIPARGKEAFGLVMRCAPLREMRAAVKGADFKLQKITTGSRRILSQQFLRAAFDIAQFHAASVGAVISDLAPQPLFDNFQHMPEMLFERKDERLKSTSRISNFVAGREERFLQYEAIVQKSFAEKKSTLIIVPTVVETLRLAKKCKNAGTPHMLIHSELTKKQMREGWQHIAIDPEPLVIIGTPLALSCPRRDIGALIIERAGARGFLRDERPYLSILACAEILAGHCGADIYLGSPAPLVSEKIQTTKTATSPTMRIIDMRPPKSDTPKKKAFELFSSEARALVISALENKRPPFLLCARRGLATSTVCDDCGTTLTCQRCGGALVLYDSKAGRIFKCPLCEQEETAALKCRVCGGWRLTALGIGLERVASEAAKLFPQAEIFTADEKTTSTRKKASVLIERFTQSASGILIGTEGILPYLEKVGEALVVSVDSLLFIPEYAAGEQALHLLMELHGLAGAEMLLQTRAPEHPLLGALTQGNMNAYIEEEAQLRKQFCYPPFAVLIRITLTGPLSRVQKEREGLEKLLALYKPERIAGRPAVRHRKLAEGHVREHLLMRMTRVQWPDKKVVALLRGLPPSVEIRVNPRTLFSD